MLFIGEKGINEGQEFEYDGKPPFPKIFKYKQNKGKYTYKMTENGKRIRDLFDVFAVVINDGKAVIHAANAKYIDVYRIEKTIELLDVKPTMMTIIEYGGDKFFEIIFEQKQ